MKKFKRVIALLVIGILGFSLVSCGAETPTDAVEKYFAAIKRGDDKTARELIVQNSENEEDLDGKLEELEDELDLDSEELEEVLEKIELTVNSEDIVDGNIATVNVTVKGVSFSGIFTSTLDKVTSEALKGKDITEDEVKNLLVEEMKNAPLEERTGNLTLNKVDGKWKIKPDTEYFHVVVG